MTGATGFIGPHLVLRLAGEGHTVLTTSRSPSGPKGGTLHIAHDFASSAAFPNVGALDAVVHLAGNGDVASIRADPAAAAQINAQGTLNALLLASRHDASFVLASSQRVYQPRPQPLDEDAPAIPREPYGYTKLAAELYVAMAGRLFGLRGTILRFFTVYGPGQVVTSGVSGIVAIFGQRAVAGEPLLVMSHQRKDLVEVSDAVQAIALSLGAPSSPPRAYNVATGMPTSVLDLARAVKHAADSDSEIVEDFSEGDPGSLVADIFRARLELGYQPQVTLIEGLHRYVEWLRASRPRTA
ncbi:MAG: UDP-glucose 4-epimerase [Chloroflexi bacterium]|nr:UDP-glucose 4-epimerase [Chloroflexota bacterium]